MLAGRIQDYAKMQRSCLAHQLNKSVGGQGLLRELPVAFGVDVAALLVKLVLDPISGAKREVLQNAEPDPHRGRVVVPGDHDPIDAINLEAMAPNPENIFLVLASGQ